MTTIKQIQQALKDRGFDPGDIDGERGRNTIAAIVAFQTAWKLPATGIVDAATLARLFPAAAAPASPAGTAAVLPWFAEAQRLIGVHEDTSAASNPLIVGWGRDLHANYGNDAIPWCGLFVGHCIASQLPSEPLPNNVLGARAWIKFGVACDPQPGAVMVFWRKSEASGLGHVGFYVAEDDVAYHLLAGNQSDQVSVARTPKDHFIGARWPRTVAAPTGHRVRADATGRLDGSQA